MSFYLARIAMPFAALLAFATCHGGVLELAVRGHAPEYAIAAAGSLIGLALTAKDKTVQ